MEKKETQKAAVLLLLVMMFLSCFALELAGAAGVIASPEKLALGKHKSLPGFALPMPQDEAGKSYLGLTGSENFKLGQIPAQVLIIEVFSFYCPHCQHAAPQVNELYREIQGRPDLKAKLKMIGIGVGNSPYEVNAFREKYKVPFPLFSDQRMEVAGMLGVKGTPTFIGVNLPGKGAPEQFYFGEGGFQDARQFLSEIIRLSCLAEEEAK